MATLYERVKHVVVERLGVDAAQVTLQASYTDDLNADSLDLVELIMALEEEFTQDEKPIHITDEEAEKIRTVQDTLNFLKAKGFKDQ